MKNWIIGLVHLKLGLHQTTKWHATFSQTGCSKIYISNKHIYQMRFDIKCNRLKSV